ncbi:metallophosphoesterase [Flavobacterium sp. F372]|uniref:Metallophosphatase domain-containing protein n=1 Tax=Flavobacterium bernardetii TaxID=2813823 RepID=A0ABR7IVK1_9FLAO|nr:metallophosphatase domain-containing protein [Flavobacterium bernardetii]MBC5833810.1 metallophosphatase domain-containing protein [Flavobacterium bernardetii]NHF69043.1 metallophosphoesterase [Flavobacterium bernardetii]
MKFVIISDTHGQHKNLTLPKGDVIIHAGDISQRGKESEIIDFLNWFKDLDFKYKIFIAGNHDFFFEKTSENDIQKIIPENIIYLCDSGIEVENIKIWGSPITPWFYDWAFNRPRGAQISHHWQLIPIDTDILITHGPAFGKLDKTTRGENVGCEDLLHIIESIQPKVHICGHIHEGYGQTTSSKTKFINASVLDEKYGLTNPPITFEL